MTVKQASAGSRSSFASRFLSRGVHERKAGRSRSRRGVNRLELLEDRLLLTADSVTVSAILGNAAGNPISGGINVYYTDASTGLSAAMGLSSSNSYSATISVQDGTTVSWDTLSSGSGLSEQWSTIFPPQTITGSTTITLPFYDQYYETFGVSTATGGTPMSASNDVTIATTTYGQPGSLTAYDNSNATGWVDNGSSVFFAAQSSNSTSTQRWQYDAAGNTASLPVTSATTLSETYYNQYQETLQATTAPGGTLMSSSNYITAAYKQFGGSSTSKIYDGANATVWIDAANSATVSFGALSYLSSSSERWAYDAVGTLPSFIPNLSTTFPAIYYNQYYQKFDATTAFGGSPMSSGNYVTVSYNSFGSPFALNTYDGATPADWVDSSASPTISYSAQSSGTTASDRWQYDAAGDAPSYIPGSSSTFDPAYYNQVSDTFQATTAAGGTPMSSSNSVQVTYVQFAMPLSQSIYDGTNGFAYVDVGSAVLFSAQSSGSNSTERWQSTQTSFTGSSTTLSDTYYNQFLDTLAATTASGGTAMSVSNYVTASYNQLGVPNTSQLYDTLSPSVWIDAASTPTVTFSPASSNSTSTDRWQSNAAGTSPSFTPNQATTFPATYFEQFYVSFGANTSGLTLMSSSNSVNASYVQFGQFVPSPTPLYDSTTFSDWVDANSSISFSPFSSGTNATERWQANSAGTSPVYTASSATAYAPTYYDQYFEQFAATTAPGGTSMSSSNDITASYPQFGQTNTLSLYDGTTGSDWVDTSTSPTVSFSSQSSGSNSYQRWVNNAALLSPNFSPGVATVFTAQYYDQYHDRFQASTMSGGTAMSSSNDIVASFSAFGTPATVSLYDNYNPLVYVDASTLPTVSFSPVSTGSVASERWQYDAAGDSPSFTPDMLSTFSATYYNQDLLSITGSPAPHGTPGSIGTTFGQLVANTGSSAFYDAGTLANATLSSGQVTESGVAYTFTGWSGGATGSAIVSSDLTMSGPQSATANWVYTPIFSNLSAPTITFGTPTTFISGTISDGNATPLPTGYVVVHLNGVSESASIDPIMGSFSAPFDTSTLAATGLPYAISITYAGDANYSSGNGNSTLTVTPSVPVITWVPSPSTIVYGTPLSSAQLDATATTPSDTPLPGTFYYAQPVGTILNAGDQTLNAVFVPTDSADYTPVSTSAGLTVQKATPTINVFPYMVTYNGATQTATGTATGIGGVTLAGLDLSATVHTNAGDYSGDPWTFTDTTGNYLSENGTITDVIGKAALTITASNAGKTYGSTWVPGPNAYVVSGLVGGDTVSGVTLNSPGAGSQVNVGNYPITASNAAGTGLGNYNIQYQPGVLQVNPAPTSVTFTTPSGSSVFGQNLPIFVQAASDAPGTPTPTGTVVFLVDGVTMASAPVNAMGQVAFDATLMNAGVHVLTAVFHAGPNFVNDSSVPMSWVVNQSSTSTGISISPIRNYGGKIVAVLLTADVGAVAPGAGQTSGVVTFYKANGMQVGSGLVNNGTATYRVGINQALRKSYWAKYNGDVNFLTSESSKVHVTAASLRASVVRLRSAAELSHQPHVMAASSRASLAERILGVMPTFFHKKRG